MLFICAISPFGLVSRVGSICILSPPFYRSLWTMTRPWWRSYWCSSLEFNQHSDCYLIPWHPDTSWEVHAMRVPDDVREGESKTSDHFYYWMTSYYRMTFLDIYLFSFLINYKQKGLPVIWLTSGNLKNSTSYVGADSTYVCFLSELLRKTLGEKPNSWETVPWPAFGTAYSLPLLTWAPTPRDWGPVSYFVSLGNLYARTGRS